MTHTPFHAFCDHEANSVASSWLRFIMAEEESMSLKLQATADHFYNGRPVSELGLRLRRIREQIEAAAARGETELLNREQLDLLLEAVKRSSL